MSDGVIGHYFGIQARACTGNEVLNTLSAWERIGAVVFDHAGGTACVHRNKYLPGLGLRLVAEPRTFVGRLLDSVLLPSPGGWSWHAQFGSCGAAATEPSRDAASAAAKRAIDRMHTGNAP